MQNNSLRAEEIIIDDITLQNKDGEILASSRDIAERFGKRHTHILDSIKEYAIQISTAEFSALFKPSEYKASNGKSNTEYLMNRDGFSLLVMGFTGKKALEWKLKYIEAFNKMEDALKHQNEMALPTTYKEALIQLLEKVEENEKLISENQTLLPKAEYHDEVLNKDGLLTTTLIAKDLGMQSAMRLNKVMEFKRIIYKKSGTWHPFAEYEWLITDEYCDYESYTNENAHPSLKWTEKGRKWILKNYQSWIDNM